MRKLCAAIALIVARQPGSPLSWQNALKALPEAAARALTEPLSGLQSQLTTTLTHAVVSNETSSTILLTQILTIAARATNIDRRPHRKAELPAHLLNAGNLVAWQAYLKPRNLPKTFTSS